MKSEKAKLNVIIRTRVTDEIGSLLSAKAVNEKIEVATVIREIISQYFENTLSDSRIVSQNMMQMKRKMTMLENKIDVMSMLVLELTKLYSATFPDRKINQEISEKYYEEIVSGIAENMKNHKGKLESMVLDIYEHSEGDEK